MRPSTPNLDMLAVVAKGLQGLKESVAFVGGAVIDLYLSDPGAPQARPSGGRRLRRGASEPDALSPTSRRSCAAWASGTPWSPIAPSADGNIAGCSWM